MLKVVVTTYKYKLITSSLTRAITVMHGCPTNVPAMLNVAFAWDKLTVSRQCITKPSLIGWRSVVVAVEVTTVDTTETTLTENIPRVTGALFGSFGRKGLSVSVLTSQITFPSGIVHVNVRLSPGHRATSPAGSSTTEQG